MMKLQLADGVRESELRRSENEIQRQARVLAQQAPMRERQKKYLKSVEGRKELDQLILSHQLPEFRELEAEPAAPPLEAQIVHQIPARDRLVEQRKAIREQQKMMKRQLNELQDEQKKCHEAAAAERHELDYNRSTGLWRVKEALRRPISSGNQPPITSSSLSVVTSARHPSPTCTTPARPATSDQKVHKTSQEMVSEISWANQRREMLRREMAQRLREELALKHEDHGTSGNHHVHKSTTVTAAGKHQCSCC
ncbi:unnamed protein product [Sphagnum troendelagicum]|uniref:Uncharacterized protein n=1 Tax=Sphagnum jensenii TaxID=128206 RepID=A0ABP0WQ70_9BRYO